MKCMNNCEVCSHFYTAEVTYDECNKKMILTVPDLGDLHNGEKVCIVPANCIPCGPCIRLEDTPVVVKFRPSLCEEEESKKGDGVVLTSGGEDKCYPIETEHCTFLYANKLHARHVLHCTMATDSEVLCVHDRDDQVNFQHDFPVLDV